MQTLVDKIKQADQKAYRELYDMFNIPMYNICLRMMNQPEDALDVLQETFIKVFQNIQQLNNGQLLPAWIKKICINTALSELDKKQKLQFDDLNDESVLYSLNSEDGVIDEFEHESNMAEIMNAIELLPERYRIVFTLYAIEDYSHEEIAQMLGIVASTSRSQYLRGKQKLLEIIKKNKQHVRSIKTIYTTA